ncbi:MAG: FxsA family protein [Acidobacteriota bacterium]
MFFRLLLLFTIVPLVELALLIEVGRIVGMPATILLVIVTGTLGAWLAKTQGVRTLNRLQQELQSARMPADTMLDGLLIFIAGAVLLTPGILTDLFGFFLLTPACRGWLRGIIKSGIKRRVTVVSQTAQAKQQPNVIFVEPED